MSKKEANNDVMEEHGTALDKDNKRVRCKYCGKEMNGFCRLKHHLAALGSDVLPCEAVPSDVKVKMKETLLEHKKQRLVKEVGEICHPDLPLRRNMMCQSNEVKPLKPQTSTKGKKVISPKSKALKRSFSSVSSQGDHILSELDPPNASSCCKETIDWLRKEHIEQNAFSSWTKFDAEVNVKEEVVDESAIYPSKCVGKFLLEAGLDLDVVKYPSFQKMIDAYVGRMAEHKLPSLEELRGWILRDEVKEAQQHVSKVKESWERTGCSIILDGWTDEAGRDLMIFLVNCPQDTVFLKSIDASTAIRDVDTLLSVLSGVVEEVGIQNVVQVVSHWTSPHMEAAGKKLMEKHTSLFWALSADYCINMILQKIGCMDHLRKVMAEARRLTKFLCSHSLPRKLNTTYLHGKNLVGKSNLKFISPVVTLENIVAERNNLINMFTSEGWNALPLASEDNGKYVANLVKEPLFWAAASNVLKGCVPLLSVLQHTDGDKETSMGCIYEAMDNAKDLIRLNYENDDTCYMPLWHTVDEIWDNYLHSPLHSAGYYLNPGLFYSNDFYVDAEVANGLLTCITRMVVDQDKQDSIILQLDAYRAASGPFAEEKAVDQRTEVSPSTWWSLYGGDTPELQGFAIRVLSQTCSGASMHMFERRFSELLHREGMNCMEKERLHDIEFVHCNLRLWQTPNLT